MGPAGPHGAPANMLRRIHVVRCGVQNTRINKHHAYTQLLCVKPDLPLLLPSRCAPGGGHGDCHGAPAVVGAVAQAAGRGLGAEGEGRAR